MINNLRARYTGKVEIAVVRQVHHGRLVGRRLIANVHSVVIGQFVSHLHRKVTREACLAVRREIGQLQGLVIKLLRIPNHSVIAFRTAMQAVAVVVLRQVIFRTIQRKLRISNTVAITTDQTTIVVVRVGHVLVDVVIAQHHIRQFTVLVRHHDRHQATAPVRHAGLSALLIGQYIQSGRFAIDLRHEFRLLQTGERLLRGCLLFLCATARCQKTERQGSHTKFLHRSYRFID